MKFLSSISIAIAGSWFLAAGAFANPLAEGLVAHYPLNEIMGEQVEDLSGNGHMAFADYIEVADGRGGKVFAFDGEKSQIVLPEVEAFEVKGDYSVSFWMRVESGSADVGRIYGQPDFAITSFKGSLRVTFSNPEIPGTGYGDLMGPAINDGEWHHVVFTYSGETGEARLYLNDEEAIKGVFAHKPALSSPTKIGSYRRSFYKGELSDLRVYSRELGPADVTALFDSKIAN